MNSTLLAIGLSNSDIQDIDRIASFTKDFNPIVYNDLIQQFEADAGQQNAAAAANGNQAQGQLKATQI